MNHHKKQQNQKVKKTIMQHSQKSQILQIHQLHDAQTTK